MTKRNENRPGYKKTKIGWIPEDWACDKLFNLGNFTNGINKDKNAFGKGTPLINLQDIFGRNAINDNPAGLVTCSNNEKRIYSLITGDVLFVRYSVKLKGVGLTAVILKNLPDCVYSGFFNSFPSEKGYFRYHVLKIYFLQFFISKDYS